MCRSDQDRYRLSMWQGSRSILRNNSLTVKTDTQMSLVFRFHDMRVLRIPFFHGNVAEERLPGLLIERSQHLLSKYCIYACAMSD